MDLKQLRSFLVVAREQNFSRAAIRLNMAQPPLSQRIRQLEEHLGVALFIRNTRRVELSAAGLAFQSAIEPLLAQLDAAVDTCHRAARGETGSLRIGYSGRASFKLLPRLMLAFRTRFPEVLLDLVGPLPSGALKTLLLNEQVDVALCFLPLKAPGLVSRPLAAIDFLLAMPASHPFASNKDVSLSSLAEEPFVAYPSNQGYLLRDAMDAQCRKAGFVPRVMRESESSQVLLYLVAAGTGVSIVPSELQTHEAIEGIVFKSLGDAALQLEHGLTWRTDNANPALHNLLAITQPEAD